MDDARYPIGPFVLELGITEADREGWIAVLEGAGTTSARPSRA